MLETKNRYPVTIILLLLIFIFLTPINSGCKKKETKAPAEKVINVQVQPAEKRPLRPFIETVGSLNPYEEVIVSAEVDGILKEVRVDEGTIVSKEMALAKIDDTDHRLEVKGAEATLRQSESTLTNTKQEYQRKEALFKEELVTRQQFDDVSTRLSLSEAELERARASLNLSQEKLRKTEIHSPISGVVKEKKTSAGNYVRNGTPLFTVIQTNPLKLNFTVTEKDVGKLKLGQDVLLRVDALPDKEFQGKLSIIYPSLEERTRTLQVEAQIPNLKGLLKPGLFAHIMLYTGSEKDTTIVPDTAILYEAEKVRVFVIEGDRAKERAVRIGHKYKLQSKVGSQESGVREFTEITEGVKEAEMVVTVGQQNLFENAKVNTVGSQESGVRSQ